MSAFEVAAHGRDPVLPLHHLRSARAPTVVRSVGEPASAGADEAREWARDVWRAVDQLAALDGRVIRLIYAERLTQFEAARSLGIPLAHVQRAAAAALRQLSLDVG